ncbi:hypothetical protein Tco_0147520 [Tanacetum coccineum]
MVYCRLSPFENLCFEDGSTADHTVRDVVIKLISDGLKNRLLSVIESLLFVAYPESMVSLLAIYIINVKDFNYEISLQVCLLVESENASSYYKSARRKAQKQEESRFEGQTKDRNKDEN